jgi:prolyl-tRNA editing enzyme YbaK/EbsC (Cys-tRNA(Pro) deacylase)
MAKVVMLTVDGNLIMAVIAGNRKLHLNTVKAQNSFNLS